MSGSDRVEELTLRVLDGTASEAETDELERLVASDARARAVHVSLVDQEVALLGEREGLDVAEAVLARVRRTVGEEIEKGVMERIRRGPPPEREGGAPMEARALEPIEPEWPWLGSGRFWLASAAAAAVVFLAVGLNAWRVSLRHAQPQEAFLYGEGEVAPGSPSAYRVFVRNARTQAPVPGANVRFVLADPEGATVWRAAAATDANGVVEVVPAIGTDFAEGRYTLRVEADSEAGQSAIARAVEVKRSFRALVTTDKPLYQPGQTIHIRALALAKADLQPVAGREAVIEVRDPKGNKVFKRIMKTSDFGIVSADFVLADQVNMGEYAVSATVGDTSSERSVEVRRYRLPKFKVGLETDRGFYAPGGS